MARRKPTQPNASGFLPTCALITVLGFAAMIATANASDAQASREASIPQRRVVEVYDQPQQLAIGDVTSDGDAIYLGRRQ